MLCSSCATFQITYEVSSSVGTVWVLVSAQFFFFSLFQTANGNVEAKVVCFYRRRDISSTLIVLADKHASKLVGVQIASTQLPNLHRTSILQLQVSLLLFLNMIFLYSSSAICSTCLDDFSLFSPPPHSFFPPFFP